MYLLVLLVATVGVALYFWSSYKTTPQRIFMPFLLYVLCNEILAYYMLNHLKLITQPLYNVYTIVAFFVYFYWFWQVLEKPKWIWVFPLLFLSAIVFDDINESFTQSLWSSSVLVLSVMSIFCSLAFFGKLLMSDNVIHYYKMQSFWVVAGVLIFFIGFVPLLLFQGILKGQTQTYQAVLAILNTVYYSFFIIGFYVSSK